MFLEQEEALEREKLARVAAEAERRAAADEAQRALAELRQAAAAQLQQARVEASEREQRLRCELPRAQWNLFRWTGLRLLLST